MNLEHREMVFEEIMKEFIILLKPSPCMLNNLFLIALKDRVDPACLALALGLATAG